MKATQVVLVALTAASASALVPAEAHAQDPQPRHVSVSIGLFQYDLSGTGLAPMVAVRGTRPLSTVLVLEAGLTGTRPDLQAGETSTFLAPEAQVQLTLPFSAFVPYMGLGVGAALDLRSSAIGGSQTDFTISGALGLRTWVSDQLGLQFEFRGRGIGVDFAGSSAEYTAGLAWRL
jgi:hypothetical protein